MTTVLHNAMCANLQLLSSSLALASTRADLAAKAMDQGEQNLAIGTVSPLEQDLPIMLGLLTAILALHRTIGQGGAA